MQINNNVKLVCDKIVSKFSPDKIILFSSKVNCSGETNSFKICIVKETDNKDELEKQIYLEIESEIQFDILIYTPNEWEKHSTNKHSFAYSICKKGTLIYGEI
jgi:acid stress-induced BolA-like protein IbaG/YrbA